MKKKKGFTLIELLAVIAILAILVIVAVPSVINMYKDAKEKAFITQAQNIYKAAEQKFMSDQLSGTTVTKYCYSKITTDTDNALDLSGSKTVYYEILVNSTTGSITSFQVTDGTTSMTKTTGPVLIGDVTATIIDDTAIDPDTGLSCAD